MIRHLAVLFLLLSLAAFADTIRLQGVDVPVKDVEGRQVIAREDVARAFPNMPEDIEFVELTKLLEHPSARITRRDGKVTSIRFYNAQMGDMWDSVKKDMPKRENVEVQDDPVYQGQSQTRRTSKKSGDWDIQEETYKRSNRRRVRFKERRSRNKNRIEQLRDEVDRGKKR